MDNEKEAKVQFKERRAAACVSGRGGRRTEQFGGPGARRPLPQFTARNLRNWDAPHGAAGLRVPEGPWWGRGRGPRASRSPEAAGPRALAGHLRGRAGGPVSDARPSPAPTARSTSASVKAAPGARAARILHQSYCGEQTINSGAKLKVRGRV